MVIGPKFPDYLPPDQPKHPSVFEMKQNIENALQDKFGQNASMQNPFGYNGPQDQDDSYVQTPPSDAGNMQSPFGSSGNQNPPGDDADLQNALNEASSLQNPTGNSAPAAPSMSSVLINLIDQFNNAKGWYQHDDIYQKIMLVLQGELPGGPSTPSTNQPPPM